jgi:hypothetical protein
VVRRQLSHPIWEAQRTTRQLIDAGGTRIGGPGPETGWNVSNILGLHDVLLREVLCCNMHLRVTFPLLGAGLALGLIGLE